jgi:hypothetical protein
LEITGTLGELLIHAAAFTEDEDDEPLQLFVQDLPLITASTPAILCNEEGRSRQKHPAYERYRYVLMLHQVQDVIGHWQQRHQRKPDEEEVCHAVMHYSEHDCHQPDLATTAHPFAWRVGRWRGEE